jgi:polyisoprenoid-binding protein YceI
MQRRLVLAATAALTILSAACDDKPKDQAATTAATSTASVQPVAKAAVSATASAAPAASAAPKDVGPAAGATRFSIFMGKGTFLINAPLEKIKGKSEEVMGHIDVDPKDIGKSRGEIDVRLSTLKTNTFGEMDKDAAQTEHARNWMEVGNESAADARMKYEWAKFTVASVEATPSSIADTKEEGGARKVKAKVTGDLVIHGVTSHKTVPVTVTFKGPADAPTDLTLKFDEPMPVSMKEHDVKPRDGVGSFLNGALERIGKKIDDKVQVSFEGDGKADMPAHP